MEIAWWMWIVLGIFMCLAEIITPGGFYLLVIGAAALLVGGLSIFVHSAVLQIILFSVFSILFILVFRKHLLKIMGKNSPEDYDKEFAGETGRTLEPISIGQEGKIELRGTGWTARNGGISDLPANAECKIISRDGLKFIIE